MANDNGNKFNIKEALDKINIFKNAGDACLNIQDKAMDIYNKHSKGSNKLFEIIV